MLKLSWGVGVIRGILGQCPLHTSRVKTVTAMAQPVFGDCLGSTRSCARDLPCAGPCVADHLSFLTHRVRLREAESVCQGFTVVRDRVGTGSHMMKSDFGSPHRPSFWQLD